MNLNRSPEHGHGFQVSLCLTAATTGLTTWSLRVSLEVKTAAVVSAAWTPLRVSLATQMAAGVCAASTLLHARASFCTVKKILTRASRSRDGSRRMRRTSTGRRTTTRTTRPRRRPSWMPSTASGRVRAGLPHDQSVSSHLADSHLADSHMPLVLPAHEIGSQRLVTIVARS